MPDPTLTAAVPNSQAAPAAPAQAAQVQTPVTQSAPSEDLSTMFSAAQAAGAGAASAAPASPAASQPASQPAAPAAPQVSALAAQAAQLGIELPATASDADVASALLSRYQQAAPLAQYAQSLLPHADQINEYFASRGQPQQAAVPAQPSEWSIDGHFQKAWDAPKLTSEMQFAINQGMVVRDAETGLMVAKPGMELMVAPLLQGLNQALNWTSEKTRDFLTNNPYRQTFDVLKDPIERLIEERIQQRFAATRSQEDAVGAVNSFEQANADWMYQAANNGGRLLTPKGQQFVKLAREMSASYTGNPVHLLELCKGYVNGASTAQPATPAAPATPAQVSQQQKSSFLQNAISNAAQQPAGGGPSSVQQPSGPTVVSPLELDNMFLNEFRARQAA